MRKIAIPGLLSLLLIAPALGQSGLPNFPQTLPANTVIGRVGVGPGPSQAIPIATLLSKITGTGGVPFAPSATIDTTNAANITSGKLPAARLPNPTAGTLGGVMAISCAGSAWVNSISLAGAPICTQPNFTDLAGSIAAGQIPLATITNGMLAGSIAASKLVGTDIATVGTIGAGTWQGTAIAAAFGGTGQTVYTIGDLLQASATGTLSKLAAVATGNVLISGGVGVVSAWGKVSLTTHVSGTLPVGNGGLGIATGTSGGVLCFTGSTTIASSVAATANAVMVGGGAGACPAPLASLGTTTTVLHGNAAGPPSFGAVSLTADVTGTLPKANGGLGATTLSSAIDTEFSNTQGAVLYRGASAWVALPPGSAGQFLTTQGAAANPNWSSGGAGTGTVTAATVTAGAGMGTFTGTCTSTTVLNCTVVGSAAQLPGIASNTAASAGNLGEYISSSIPSGSAVALTSGVAKDITTVTISAGDWECTGNAAYLVGGTTNVTSTLAWTSATANAIPTQPNGGGITAVNGISSTGTAPIMSAGTARYLVNANTTISLGTFSQFTVSTSSGYGFIGCRRMR